MSPSDEEMEKFSAFRSEYEAESCYLIPHGGPARVGFLRVFSEPGKPGLVRIDISPSEDHSEHIQVLVGREQLLRRASQPQDAEPLELPPSA